MIRRLLINDIFYGVFEEGRSVSDAIKDSEMFHGMSLDYIKDKMIEENLIEEKFNDRPFSYNHHQRTEFYRDIDEVIQQKIKALEKI